MTKRIARTADIAALEADPGTQEWWKLTETWHLGPPGETATP
ncbi:hypothetical protein [Streptomyces sp. NPDC006334]